MATCTEANPLLIGKLAANTFLRTYSKLRFQETQYVSPLKNLKSTGRLSISSYYIPTGFHTTLYEETIPLTINTVGSTWYVSCDVTRDLPISYSSDVSNYQLKVSVMVSNEGGSGYSLIAPNGTVLNYSEPSITSFIVSRSNSAGTPDYQGSYASFNSSIRVSYINGSNPTTLGVQTRVADGAWGGISYPSFSSSTSGDITTYSTTNRLLSGSFSTSTRYEVRLIVTDVLNSRTVSAFISAGGILMHFKGDGTGIGIGAYATTSNMFDVSIPTRFNNVVNMYSSAYVASLSLGSALSVTYGGTGSNNITTAQSNLGILSGSLTTSLPSNALKSGTVYFPSTFTSTPVIVSGWGYDGTPGTGTVIKLEITSVGTSSFYWRLSSSGSGTATTTIRWIAVGPK